MKDSIIKINLIEDSFFELDHVNKKVLMRLKYDSPNDIFNTNIVTKIPTLNEEFFEWIKSSFENAPRDYKIDLVISFNDMKGYTSEDLKEIFIKNTILEAVKSLKVTKAKSKIAFSLIFIGILFFISMMLINSFWTSENIIKDIVKYIMDIATTVTIWEALTILIIENKEKRDLTRNLYKRFDYIEFVELHNDDKVS